MTIRTKLYFGFTALIALSVVAQIVIWINITSTDHAFRTFSDVDTRLLQLSGDIRYYDASLTDAVRGILIDPEDRSLYTRYESELAALDGALAEVQTLLTTQEDLVIFRTLGEINAGLADLEVQILENPDITQARELYRGEYGRLKAAYAEQVALLYQNQVATFLDDERAIADKLSLIKTVSLFFVGCVVVVGAGLAISLARHFSVPLQKLTLAAEAVSAGDLSTQVDIDRKDELGIMANVFNEMVGNLRTTMSTQIAKDTIERVVSNYQTFVEHVAGGDLTATLALDDATGNDDLRVLGENLNRMTQNLRGMAQQVRSASAAVISASTEIQAAASQQVAGAAEQDAAITQTVATVEEVRQTVIQTAERAQTVAGTSQQASEVVSSGSQAVSDTIEGMAVIQQRVESIAETILLLSERTQQIGDIIDTVDAIADQSKMLALNASIEAARAGEEGKGFAVVAMEVRQLAEQSREATARVGAILSEIQNATNTAVMVTEEGSKGADRGMQLAERAGDAIHELATTIANAAQASTQIAASAHQQTNGMDQLASAMMQIKQASTQTAATLRQTEQSVRDLMNMARQLEEAAARYQL